MKLAGPAGPASQRGAQARAPLLRVHIALFALAVQVVTAVRVKVNRCGVECQNGGICLPSPDGDNGATEASAVGATGDASGSKNGAWSCLCRAPWSGLDCTLREDSESLPGAADFAGLAVDPPNPQLLIPPPPAPQAVTADVAAREAFLETRELELKERLRALKQGASSTGAPVEQPFAAATTVKPAVAQGPDSFKNALYGALCNTSPCPFGLALEDIRVLERNGPAVHLAIAPSSSEVSLQVVKLELEKQLGDMGSALRQAGGVLLDLKPSQIGVWFAPHPGMPTPLPAARQVLTPPPPAAKAQPLAALAVGTQASHGANKSGAVAAQSPPPFLGPAPAPAPISVDQEAHQAAENVQDQVDAASDAYTTEDESNMDELMGVKSNAKGDLHAFLTAVGFNSAMAIVYVGIFCYLRQKFPPVYQHKGTPVGTKLFDWVHASMKLEPAEIMEVAGLDQAMLVEFSALAIRIVGSIMVPFVLIFCPLHAFLGGGAAHDRLSKPGMANVEQRSWICWIHCFGVWYVVGITHYWMRESMKTFCGDGTTGSSKKALRNKWLRELPSPQNKTILVESLQNQDDHDAPVTEDSVRRYFQGVFGKKDIIERVEVCKDVGDLVKLDKEIKDLEEDLERKMENKEDLKGKLMPKSVEEMKKDIETKKEEFKQAQVEVEDDDQYNTDRAFITFKRRREQAICLKLFSEDDKEEIVCRLPPPPKDVIWSDMYGGENVQEGKETLGMILLLGLFWIFMPLVLVLAKYGRIESLEGLMPFLSDILLLYPGIRPTWNGMVGPMALTIMMGQVPGIMMMIFTNFFVLRANLFAQERLQVWYFWFQVVFVLLVTALGDSLTATFLKIVTEPMTVFVILATTIPHTTHFYMNYMPVQWASVAMSLSRYMIAFKFYGFKKVAETVKKKSPEDAEKEAAESAEPEDQTFEGIGGRNSRLSLLLVVILTFASLCPIMTILGFIFFLLVRLFYGYLVTYAEILKDDSGGVFYVIACKQTQQGLFIYTILMAGVLFHRSASSLPGIIAIAAFVENLWAMKRFEDDFRWESLDFKELDALDALDNSTASHEDYQHYKSPMLPPPPKPKQSGGWNFGASFGTH